MGTNGDEKDNDQSYQLSTTDNESNDETEDTIDSDKPAPIYVAQIVTYITSPIAAVPIVVTKAPVIKSDKVPACLS